MSNILDKFAEAVADASGDPKWIEKAIEAARKELPEGGGQEVTAIRNSGIYALSKLEEHKDELAALSERQVIAFLGRASLGNFRKAGEAYAGTKPGSRWASAHAAIDQAGDDTEQAKRDYDAGVALAKEIGSTAAKSLLPLLMAVL